MLNKVKATTKSYLTGNLCPSKLPISGFKLPYPSTITQRANVFTPFYDSKDTEHQKKLELDQNFQFYFCVFFLTRNSRSSKQSRKIYIQDFVSISNNWGISTHNHAFLQCGDNVTKRKQ